MTHIGPLCLKYIPYKNEDVQIESGNIVYQVIQNILSHM